MRYHNGTKPWNAINFDAVPFDSIGNPFFFWNVSSFGDKLYPVILVEIRMTNVKSDKNLPTKREI